MRLGSRFIEASLGWLKKATFAMTTKAALCGITLVLFSVAITWFYYTLAYVKMDWIECWWFKERWRNSILGIGTLTVFYFDKGEKSAIHWNFVTTFKCAILFTYLIVILVNFGFIKQPYLYFLSLDAGVFFTTATILFLGLKHGILDD